MELRLPLDGVAQSVKETIIRIISVAFSYTPYEMLYRRPPSLLKLVDFVKTKRPKIITLQTEAKKLDYERFFHLTSQILRGIRSGVFFPRKSFMCKDCEYGGPCKVWRGD